MPGIQLNVPQGGISLPGINVPSFQPTLLPMPLAAVKRDQGGMESIGNSIAGILQQLDPEYQKQKEMEAQRQAILLQTIQAKLEGEKLGNEQLRAQIGFAQRKAAQEAAIDSRIDQLTESLKPKATLQGTVVPRETPGNAAPSKIPLFNATPEESDQRLLFGDIPTSNDFSIPNVPRQRTTLNPTPVDSSTSASTEPPHETPTSFRMDSMRTLAGAKTLASQVLPDESAPNVSSVKVAAPKTEERNSPSVASEASQEASDASGAIPTASRTEAAPTGQARSENAPPQMSERDLAMLELINLKKMRGRSLTEEESAFKRQKDFQQKLWEDRQEKEMEEAVKRAAASEDISKKSEAEIRQKAAEKGMADFSTAPLADVAKFLGKKEDANTYQQSKREGVLDSISDLEKRVGQNTTGIGGGVLRWTPWNTEAKDFEADLETLKSQIAFGELAAMRAASKTGGALGAVSEKEMKLLESSLAGLSLSQSPENFSKNLKRIRESIENWKQMEASGTGKSHENSSAMSQTKSGNKFQLVR